MSSQVSLPPWHTQIGSQRDWVWRGWQIRYTYIRAAQPSPARDLPPLIFLHGFGSALTQWQANLRPLSQFHNVYAIDLLGFGASEKAAESYNVSLWVEQVYEFWRTLIGVPAVWVGHSLGALVALTAAATHPELVQGLVLITLPAARQELLPGRLQAMVGKIEALFTTPLLIRPLFHMVRRPSMVRSILRLAYADSNRVTEEVVMSFATPGLDRGAARAFCRLAQARTKNDFSPLTKALLPGVQVPILMLWGEQDRVIPLTWGRQLSPLNPQVTLVEIPEAGHCLYDECSDRVNQEILNWLAVQEGETDRSDRTP
ncbi:alpha/beta fold hydrolase [Oculatella sp. LEGE 06141]|uniref:alpha/beta fold hydrolase n=1 Tax=Oculatella sp. LEGE 06141 TaxID=1828648 RepID=UPI001880D5A0|nr:alpha/beta fold hydrolase [Oculatella sp. LEGE 06141]MBE9179674.1 alpha/beta fold hydrolase [Oculatella sp. LEGE 06141]